MIVDKINRYLSDNDVRMNELLEKEVADLSGYVFKRQFMQEKEDRRAMGISSIGKCPRQLAYSDFNFEKKGKEIDGRARCNFWIGDMTEIMVVALAKLAGVQLLATGKEQLTVNFDINDEIQIAGHPDGIIVDKGFHLLEVKSMSDWAFKSFLLGVIDASYIAQVQCYMAALKLDSCVFVGFNKANGLLHEMIVKRDDSIVEMCRGNVNKVLRSTPEKLPDRVYGANDKGFYPWQCLYCAYWGHCWLNAEKVLVGKAYKLKEKKEAKDVLEKECGSRATQK